MQTRSLAWRLLERARMQGYSGGPTRPQSGTRRRIGRVLVIDDEPRICEAIALVLADHVVTSVYCAEDAFARFTRGERYDVILCDIRMPGVSGIDLYDQLLETDAERAESVVFITGDVSRPDVRAFLDRVPNGLVEKPFDPDALRAFVDRMMTVDRHRVRPHRHDRGASCDRS